MNTFKYFDDILAVNNPNFEKYVQDIYSKELRLAKSNNNSTRTPFLD